MEYVSMSKPVLDSNSVMFAFNKYTGYIDSVA